ncbi:MAG: hypothetical protein WDZ76_03900 [Pseudohongiellaceae bacterium]
MLDLLPLLRWIEHSALGDAVRGAGVWSYGIINLVHILAVATLFGSILIFDLRLLGWRRNTAIATVASLTVPLAIGAFCLAVLSGACLLATNATDYAGNPFLIIKFTALAVALLNLLLFTRTAAWKSVRSGNADTSRQTVLAAFGGVSLLSWLIVIGSGRMIGYW